MELEEAQTNSQISVNIEWLLMRIERFSNRTNINFYINLHTQRIQLLQQWQSRLDPSSDFFHRKLHVTRADAGLTSFLGLPVQELEPTHPLGPDIWSAQLLNIVTEFFQTGRKRNTSKLNSYKPSVPFLGHRQTVQTQIRHRRTRHLIRVSHCLLTGISIWNGTKMKKVHQTPLKLEID